MKTKEGEFEFDFAAAKTVEKLDAPGQHTPEGMKLVDFIIEEEHRFLMVEVKDPSCKSQGRYAAAEDALEKERTKFVKKFQDNTLINQELTPKARDSYCYFHLMKRDSKPFLYVFLLGADKLTFDPALILGFKDRLLARIRQEGSQPWQRHYIVDCLVLTESTWISCFPQYPLTRTV